MVSAEQPAQVPLCAPTIDDPGLYANLVKAGMQTSGNLPMSLVKWSFVGLLLLAAGELGAFILVALGIGWLPALALLLVSSAVGVAVLKNKARQEIGALRAALAADRGGSATLQGPRLAPLLAGILLALPGFITGLAGGLLLLPPIQAWASAAIGRVLQERARKRENVIDLEPGQWHDVAGPTPARPTSIGRGDSTTG